MPSQPISIPPKPADVNQQNPSNQSKKIAHGDIRLIHGFRINENYELCFILETFERPGVKLQVPHHRISEQILHSAQCQKMYQKFGARDYKELQQILIQDVKRKQLELNKQMQATIKTEKVDTNADDLKDDQIMLAHTKIVKPTSSTSSTYPSSHIAFRQTEIPQTVHSNTNSNTTSTEQDHPSISNLTQSRITRSTSRSSSLQSNHIRPSLREREEIQISDKPPIICSVNKKRRRSVQSVRSKIDTVKSRLTEPEQPRKGKKRKSSSLQYDNIRRSKRLRNIAPEPISCVTSLLPRLPPPSACKPKNQRTDSDREDGESPQIPDKEQRQREIAAALRARSSIQCIVPPKPSPPVSPTQNARNQRNHQRFQCDRGNASISEMPEPNTEDDPVEEAVDDAVNEQRQSEKRTNEHDHYDEATTMTNTTACSSSSSSCSSSLIEGNAPIPELYENRVLDLDSGSSSSSCSSNDLRVTPPKKTRVSGRKRPRFDDISCDDELNDSRKRRKHCNENNSIHNHNGKNTNKHADSDHCDGRHDQMQQELAQYTMDIAVPSPPPLCPIESDGTDNEFNAPRVDNIRSENIYLPRQQTECEWDDGYIYELLGEQGEQYEALQVEKKEIDRINRQIMQHVDSEIDRINHLIQIDGDSISPIQKWSEILVEGERDFDDDDGGDAMYESWTSQQVVAWIETIENGVFAVASTNNPCVELFKQNVLRNNVRGKDLVGVHDLVLKLLGLTDENLRGLVLNNIERLLSN